MTRAEVLEAAKAAITGQRSQDHGEMENRFDVIADFWSAYLDQEVSAKDVGIMMALLKIARIKTGHDEHNSYIDACGYMACAAELETDESGIPIMPTQVIKNCEGCKFRLIGTKYCVLYCSYSGTRCGNYTPQK